VAKPQVHVVVYWNLQHETHGATSVVVKGTVRGEMKLKNRATKNAESLRIKVCRTLERGAHDQLIAISDKLTSSSEY